MAENDQKLVNLADARLLYEDLRDRIEDIDIPVQDVQVNGSSVLSNGVAQIPLAHSGDYGLVKLASTPGLRFTSQNLLEVAPVSSVSIKAGTDTRGPITANRQHESVFYGLAKAAGDSTQASSSNAVGTYTDDAKTAIRSMIGAENGDDIIKVQDTQPSSSATKIWLPETAPNGVQVPTYEEFTEAQSSKVDKSALDDSGITAKTYSTKFGGEFSVTTAVNASYISPYARASVTGRFNKENMHRVTVNGTQYILPTRLWYHNSTSLLKVYEYLGNLNLYINGISGSIPGGTDDVPFIIISDLNNSSSIDVLTQTAGEYTILVEQINVTQKALPTSLIYGDSYPPILKNNNGGTYNGFSIGVNELSNKRATIALGYANKISNEFSTAIGNGNTISGTNSIALGTDNIVSGNNSLGMGTYTRVNASCMFAIGRNNAESDTSAFSNWQANTQYNIGDRVTTTVSGITIYVVCIVDHTSSSSFTSDISKWVVSPTNGDTSFVIGNGTSGALTGKNAAKFDYAGNLFLGGDVYVRCNSASKNGTKLPRDIQVNGTSVVSNGVANVPIASTSDFGVVKVGNGLTISSNTLATNYASESIIKSGSNNYRVIVPSNQHQSTFYGLAKASGDTSQSSSSNAVGTYTEDALSKISDMLNAPVNVSGSTPSITAKSGIRYVCGECSTLSITLPSSGDVEIIFESGSTATVLTLVPPTGVTSVKFPAWFNANSLSTNCTYDMIITDGKYGVVTAWT